MIPKVTALASYTLLLFLLAHPVGAASSLVKEVPQELTGKNANLDSTSASLAIVAPEDAWEELLPGHDDKEERTLQDEIPTITLYNEAFGSDSHTTGSFTELGSNETLRAESPALDALLAPQVIESKIVGGEDATAGQFPFYASSSGRPSLCGASLIRPDLLLSAAHCEGAFTGGVFIGSTRLGQNGVFRSVAAQIPHPLYNARTIAYDYMIIQLTEPVTDVDPLPINLNPADSPTGGEELTVMGFGTTSFQGSISTTLQHVNSTAVSFATCARQYRGISNIDRDIMLCAGTQDNEGSCQGDSGGPLINANGVQVGIVSFGVGCGDSDFPGVYARTSGAADWISSQICTLSANPPASCDDSVVGADADGGVATDPPSNGDGNSDETTTITLTIQVDSFPWETTFEIRNEAGRTVASGPSPRPSRNELWEVTYVNVPSATYTLIVYDSFCDGLVSSNDPSLSSFFTVTDDADGTILAQSGPDFGCQATVNFVVGGSDEDDGDVKNDGNFNCVRNPGRSDFSCLYDIEPFPVESEPSFLFAVCDTFPFPSGIPTNDNCICGVFLGVSNLPNQELCASCEFVSNSNSTSERDWDVMYTCSNIRQGDCVGRNANGDCVTKSTCVENSTKAIAINDDTSSTCDWLSENLETYAFLCEFQDVALACPATCNICDAVEEASVCQDQTDAIDIEAAPAGSATCEWLSSNFNRYSYACDRTSVALACPETCGTCTV
jgi:secreted trypsin-like serine protease